MLDRVLDRVSDRVLDHVLDRVSSAMPIIQIPVNALKIIRFAATNRIARSIFMSAKEWVAGKLVQPANFFFRRK